MKKYTLDCVIMRMESEVNGTLSFLSFCDVCSTDCR